jgi:Zn-finger nucleic acid-binding protein
MKCPACGKQMEEITVEGVCVDFCRLGCGGVWFDRFELQKMDERHELAGERLLDIEVEGNSQVDPSERRNCPKCGDLVLMRHFFTPKREIEVDECPGCAGLWVDRGELHKIRDQFADEEERDRATKQYLEEQFSDDLDEIRHQSEERLDKARKFARLFRFVCPSYYIPGKQRGGAF